MKDDWSPTGAPFSVSERASNSAELERAYRRLVTCYPRSFRRENTEEIIAVLLATAREDQRRPSLAEAADLLRGAARMRLGLSNCPRTVLHAVRLMYLGALAEVAVLAITVLSAGSIRAAAQAVAIRGLGPHPDHAIVAQTLAQVGSLVDTDLTADVMLGLFAVAGWLFFAWVNGKGYPSARGGAIIMCAFYTAGVALLVVRGDASIAPASVIASGVEAAIGVISIILLVMKQSWPYYERRSVAR